MATLKKLPPACVAPLHLHAITLHGIGSYRTAARLEIRPLAILRDTLLPKLLNGELSVAAIKRWRPAGK